MSYQSNYDGVPNDEIEYNGVTLRVWYREAKDIWEVTVDGDTVGTGDTKEDAVREAKEAMA